MSSPLMTQKATRQFRNTSSDANTQTSPQNPLRVSSSRRPSMNRARLVDVLSVPILG